MKNDIGPMKDRNDNDLQKKERSQEEIKIVKFLKKRETNGICEIRTTDKTLGTRTSEIISYEKMQGRPSLNVNIHGVYVDCLLDTGARVNVMGADIANRISGAKIEPSTDKLRCANDSKLEVLGKVELEVSIGKREAKIIFVVVKNISPAVIAGIDMQRQLGLELQWIDITLDKPEEFICDIEAKFGQRITNEDRMEKIRMTIDLEKFPRLMDIISRHRGVFMANKWDIGCTKLITHKIVTNGGPINMKPRRQPMHLESKIEETIKNLFDNGIIRKCNSPWNTPLVCVWKKESADVRLCLDFRQLNQITERQAFPMPNAEEMMDTLHGTKYFSTIDLGNAFYQIELDPESQEKTAFSTKSGQFCFTRMPFGIAAAPGTFQEVMTKILATIKNGASVYLDDILVATETLDEHYTVLEEVIKRVGDAGLRLNPEKCKFLRKEVKFLGHIINKYGIQTDPSKIDAIRTFTRPKCIKSVRSFLGICNYYRRFIKDYARKSRALESMCGNNQAKLVWTDACETAFDEMKKALMEAPILTFPDFKKEFILDTDASFDTIGAVLSQTDVSGREFVIAYGSKAMNSHEKGYCITRKELLAVYYFCDHFKHYLYGKRFVLRTDHKAITFMMNTRKPITAQFQTWLNYLSSLDIDMRFRKGSQHGNADMLSRKDCGTCTQCLMEHEDAKKHKMKTRILTMSPIKTISYWQENDKDIEMIKKSADGGRFIVKNGTVYTEDGKIWIPDNKKTEFITHIHKLLCHAGAEKTDKYIKNNFDMNTRGKTVKDTIEGCISCQQTKTLTTQTKEKTVKIQSDEPFEKIYIDICGPFRETLKKEKYIIAIIDHFSKYIVLTACATQEENTIVNIINKNWIMKFGSPKEIHVDCGKSFISKKMADLAAEVGTTLIFSSPYHHNTNGIIERQFRTIREYINASLKDKDKTNWATLLPEIEFSLNATVQKTTGFSPAEVVFGRQINRSGWLPLNKIPPADIIKKIREKHIKNTEITRRHFQIGEVVWIKKEIRDKHQDKYEGPYTIIHKIHDRSYILRNSDNKVVTRNVEKLKILKKGGM